VSGRRAACGSSADIKRISTYSTKAWRVNCVSPKGITVVSTMEALAEFWADNGLDHIVPRTGDEFPEGFNVFELLLQLVDPTKSVLDVGCGYGRLCPAFPAASYIGVDVNPAAIDAARQRNPGYRFEHIRPGAPLPKASAALVYTVACHIPDEELARFLTPICAAAPVVAICEIMDRRWRRPGNPPIFNRDPEQYLLEMANHGFQLCRFSKVIYARYNTPSWNVNHDVRMTFHAYLKEQPDRFFGSHRGRRFDIP
jgi:SAM-dependent methyltransferase